MTRPATFPVHQLLGLRRVLKDWSHEEAATHLGVDATTYRSWEDGDTRPGTAAQVRIEAVFLIPLEWWDDAGEEPPTASPYQAGPPPEPGCYVVAIPGSPHSAQVAWWSGGWTDFEGNLIEGDGFHWFRVPLPP